MELLFEKGGEGRRSRYLPSCDVPELAPKTHLRASAPNLPQLSEVEVDRHYEALSRRAYGVCDGFYPLGSCTMKYNPAVNEDLAALPGWPGDLPLLPVLPLAVLLEKRDVLHAMLHGFDWSGFKAGGHKTLAGAANHVLGLSSGARDKDGHLLPGLRDGKKRFADAALAMGQAFTLCCTLHEAKAVRDEVAFLQAVKVILTKRDTSRQK